MHLIIISGASRGFGRAVALSWSESLRGPAHFILTGRDQIGLENTKLLIQNSRLDPNKTICDTCIADLSDLSRLEIYLSNIFSLIKSSISYSNLVFINNAGTLGFLGLVGSSSLNLSELAIAVNLNVTSSIFFTSEILKKFLSDGFGHDVKLSIVNVSSLCAIEAFDSFGIYSAGKAAREMFHKVVANENKSNTSIRILNYAPGPLDNDMQKEVRESKTIDEGSRKAYVGMKLENKLVDPKESAKKLINLLMNNNYITGSHVDFYDLPTPTTCCGCAYCTCGPNCQCRIEKTPQCDDCTSYINNY